MRTIRNFSACADISLSGQPKTKFERTGRGTGITHRAQCMIIVRNKDKGALLSIAPGVVAFPMVEVPDHKSLGEVVSSFLRSRCLVGELAGTLSLIGQFTPDSHSPPIYVIFYESPKKETSAFASAEAHWLTLKDMKKLQSEVSGELLALFVKQEDRGLGHDTSGKLVVWTEAVETEVLADVAKRSEEVAVRRRINELLAA